MSNNELEQAFNYGHCSAAKGESDLTCPYPLSGQEAEAWFNGYDEYQASPAREFFDCPCHQ